MGGRTRRRVIFTGLVAALTLAAGGCGSTGVSERDAAALLDAMPKVENASCARVDGREFVCRGAIEGEPITAHATVSEDGDSIVVTRCSDGRAGSWRHPCEELP